MRGRRSGGLKKRSIFFVVFFFLCLSLSFSDMIYWSQTKVNDLITFFGAFSFYGRHHFARIVYTLECTHACLCRVCVYLYISFIRLPVRMKHVIVLTFEFHRPTWFLSSEIGIEFSVQSKIKTNAKLTAHKHFSNAFCSWIHQKQRFFRANMCILVVFFFK